MPILDGATFATFAVKLSKPAAEPVTVSWKTKSVNAVPGVDYREAQGDLTFLPTETTKIVKILVYGRAPGDTAERTFSFEIEPAPNVVLGDAAVDLVISVNDDEDAPVANLVFAKGRDGLSAYEIARLQGYTGTAEEWQAALTTAVEAVEAVPAILEARDAVLSVSAEILGCVQAIDDEVAQRRDLIEPGEAAIVRDGDGHVAARFTGRAVEIGGGMILSAEGEDFVVRDRDGFVQMRISATSLQLGGRLHIEPRGEDVLIRDADGFVAARITAKGIDIAGSGGIAVSSDGFVVRDADGFVAMRVNARGELTVMGQPILSPTTIATLRRDREGIYVPRARMMARWRFARGRIPGALGPACVIFAGDSNTCGVAALGGANHRRLHSMPDHVARILPPWMRARADGYLGSCGTGGALPAYDPRLVLGSGWGFNGAASLGGEAFRNSTTTTPLTFTPVTSWDTADVWVRVPSAATLSIGIAGDMQSWTPAVGSIVKLSYSGATAVQGLQIARVSGPVEVLGWQCYEAAAPSAMLLGAGRANWRSDHYRAVAGDFAAFQPDLVVLQLGLNDLIQSRDVALYEADMMATADDIVATGSSLAIMVSFTPLNGETHFGWKWSDYVAAMYRVAAAHDAPVIDLGARLGPFSEASTTGFTADGAHLLSQGYAESAMPVALLLAQ